MFKSTGSYIRLFKGNTPKSNHRSVLIRRELIFLGRIKQYHDSHNVLFFFPLESEEHSSILLVYDPTSPSASPSPVEKTKNVEEVEKELLKWAKDAADVKSQSISVEKKWHNAVIGRGGTTLNA